MSQYHPFTCSIKNTLTKKQEQTLQTVERICMCFLDKPSKSLVWRTQSEICKFSGLSKGAVSLYLRDLIKQGVIKGEVRVGEKARLLPFFLYTGKCYKIVGKIGESEIRKTHTKEGHVRYEYAPKTGNKQPSTIQAVRLEYDEQGVISAQWGVSKRGKPRSRKRAETPETRYFQPHNNLDKIYFQDDEKKVKPQ